MAAAGARCDRPGKVSFAAILSPHRMPMLSEACAPLRMHDLRTRADAASDEDSAASPTRAFVPAPGRPRSRRALTLGPPSAHGRGATRGHR